MPYVTTIERMGIEQGRAEGHVEGAREQALRMIESGLRSRFGERGLALMPAIRQITSLERLEAIHNSLWTAGSLEELPLDGAVS